MDGKQKIESGFIIKNIILVESNFSRVNNVVFDSPKNNININVNVAVANNIITVEETIDLVQKHGDNEQMKFHVKMVGIFEKIGESELNDLDKFGRINGASIIYPYIREHITSVTLKAGVGAVLLPPVNFTNQVVEKQINKESN